MDMTTCLDITPGGVNIISKTWPEVIQSPTSPTTQLVFSSWDAFQKMPVSLRDQAIKQYEIPSILTTPLCLQSNGFSGCNCIAREEAKSSYNHWSRFIVKQVYKNLETKRTFTRHDSIGLPIHDKTTIKHGWEWFEMTFFVHWSASNATIMCFDCPSHLQEAVQQGIIEKKDTFDHSNPYSIFTLIMAEVLALYNTSVWAMRDHVCYWEANRREKADYSLLHEMARHMIHVGETLQVAITSLSNIQTQQRNFMRHIPNTSADTRSDLDMQLQFQLQMMQGLLHRSEANSQRLQNELTLAFHNTSQKSSNVQITIGEEAKKEAMAMKAIALVTMLFLPATFVASLFSTSFFSYEQPAGQNGFAVSSYFWVYWILTIPLSFATWGVWTWERRKWEGDGGVLGRKYHHRSEDKCEKDELEMIKIGTEAV